MSLLLHPLHRRALSSHQLNSVRTTYLYICRQCIQNRLFSSSNAAGNTSTTPTLDSALSHLPKKGKALLSPTTRRLISVYGRDSMKYLQGLTTINIPGMSGLPPATPLLGGPIHPPTIPTIAGTGTGAGSGAYTAFLNAQGRLLYDVFIYHVTPNPIWREYIQSKPNKKAGDEDDPAYFLECDARVLEELVRHVKRYKLRSKIDIEVVEEGGLGKWDIWAVWQEGSKGFWTPQVTEGSGGKDGVIWAYDSRAPNLFTRILIPTTSSSSPTSPSSSPTPTATLSTTYSHPSLPLHPTYPVEIYQLRRYLHGVPEGRTELPPGDTLPQEGNVDIMGGVDFHKGCYVGQELTIRTRHRGVVRKRVVPLRIYDPVGDGTVRFVPPATVKREDASGDGDGAEGALQEAEEYLSIKRSLPPDSPRILGERKGKVGRWLGSIPGMSLLGVGLGSVRLESMFPKLSALGATVTLDPPTPSPSAQSASPASVETEGIVAEVNEPTKGGGLEGTEVAMESEGEFRIEWMDGERGERREVGVKGFIPKWWGERGVEGVGRGVEGVGRGVEGVGRGV